uniref:Uncharacterized protein n=1 Tax=Fagus sylvatica TaxID=28930 RepID=A0A2N9HCE0_FAGSY
MSGKFGMEREKKQGRGSTRNLKLAKEFKGKRFPITWLNGRAVGEHARSLINECTKLVREEHNVPLKVKTWRDVPYEKKRKLFDNILEFFEVEGREEDVWRQMGSSLKNYRDSLKRKWLKPYGDAIEEARANVPPGIAKDDWNDLVDWWTNEDYMEMCLINKKNRGENKIVHTSGSKSFQQRNVEEILGLWGLIVGAKVGVFGADFGELGFWSGYLNGEGHLLIAITNSIFEIEKTGHQITRVQLFEITHVQSDGLAVNKETQDSLMTLRSLTTQVNEGSLQMSEDQMFVEVFGPERHGRVRGYGAGVTATKLWGSSSSKINDLEKRLQESEQMRLEANAKANAKVELLEEQVIQLKDLLEERSTQMEQQAIRVEALMAQMMAYMTPRETGKKKKTARVA